MCRVLESTSLLYTKRYRGFVVYRILETIYANDMALVADNLQDMQVILQCFADTANRFRLSVNPQNAVSMRHEPDGQTAGTFAITDQPD